jgi:hypothetical protein
MVTIMKRSELSPRTLKLFAEAEHLAVRFAELTSEEARLRRSADALWQEKTLVMALLADAARKASMAEAAETLKHAARGAPAQAS